MDRRREEGHLALHTPHALFNSPVLVRELMLALNTRCLCGVGTEDLVWRMRWTGNRSATIKERSGVRLLGIRGTDNNKTATLLYAVENRLR